MTRSFFSLFAVGFVGLALAPALLEGCKQTGVGDPCVPEQEYQQDFAGFSPGEVDVESKSFQCQTRLCLVNHFRGRVTCPYGQDNNGKPSLDANGNLYKDAHGQPIAACGIPGSSADPTTGAQSIPVTGTPDSTGKLDATVPSQCQSRQADKTVYCSCRCADINGKTDTGENFCKCPDGYSCTQLVTSIGPTDTGLTGAYCIKSGTDYKGTTDTCQPSTKQTSANDSCNFSSGKPSCG
jgi:hypothetical protein